MAAADSCGRRRRRRVSARAPRSARSPFRPASPLTPPRSSVYLISSVSVAQFCWGFFLAQSLLLFCFVCSFVRSLVSTEDKVNVTGVEAPASSSSSSAHRGRSLSPSCLALSSFVNRRFLRIFAFAHSVELWLDVAELYWFVTVLFCFKFALSIERLILVCCAAIVGASMKLKRALAKRECAPNTIRLQHNFDLVLCVVRRCRIWNRTCLLPVSEHARRELRHRGEC